ncbi:hypothetical protein VKT23_007855 [Stygiomarasmius scandens]|uniref:Uncharacterized protein n=1 Tax=Marasmiellus scandens TaxID=2682957 RepID=A0ABR1JJI8_9AGAR
MLGRNHSGQTRGVLRIVAPKLCELHIHLRNEFGYAFTYEPLAKLFRGLECPKLQSLSLTSSGGSSFSGYSQHGHAEQSCRAALIDFITHSDLTSKLRRLAVKEMSMTTTDMIIVLKSLLAITDLTIHDVSVADGRGLSLFGGRSSSNHILVQEFFQEFCVVREDATLPIDSGHDITSPLLPNLYRMELKLADIQEDVKELRRMVHSRWDISCSSPVTRLGCVVVLLTSDGGLPEDEWEDFHRYKKEGMLVKVQRVRGQQVIVGD